MPTKAPQFKITSGPRQRPAYHYLYRTQRWKKYRSDYLSRTENLLCACGCGKLSNALDHIIPHRGDEELFWSPENHQALNTDCHNKKSASEKLS